MFQTTNQTTLIVMIRISFKTQPLVPLVVA